MKRAQRLYGWAVAIGKMPVSRPRPILDVMSAAIIGRLHVSSRFFGTAAKPHLPILGNLMAFVP